MVPLLLAEVQKRKIPMTTLVEKVSRKPCEILGIPPAGFAPGERADFALYPKEITRVDPRRPAQPGRVVTLRRASRNIS